MNLLKKIILFNCINFVAVIAVWTLFGAEMKFILSTGKTYILPLIITCVGLLFGLGVPLLLYNPNRKAIFLWSQIISTVLFCCLIVKLSFDEQDADKEYQSRKDKPENIIREY